MIQIPDFDFLPWKMDSPVVKSSELRIEELILWICHMEKLKQKQNTSHEFRMHRPYLLREEHMDELTRYDSNLPEYGSGDAFSLLEHQTYSPQPQNSAVLSLLI